MRKKGQRLFLRYRTPRHREQGAKGGTVASGWPAVPDLAADELKSISILEEWLTNRHGTEVRLAAYQSPENKSDPGG